MIRPNEITLLVLDDIDKWLSKYDYEEIELLENNGDIFIKAKKSYDGHLFDVYIEYNDATRIVYTTVYCLTPVPKDKRRLCLKLINFIGYSEKEIKYHLCPVNHMIFCCTSHSILDCRCSIGQLVESQASCSIENLSVTHNTIKNDNLKISNIHPIRFNNDFWKGIDYV
jgi:hypothetical protein